MNRLELLGSMRVTLGSPSARRIESAKGRALLAYLATEANTAHTRSRLAGLLWPDEPETTARHNLSQALSNIRQAVGVSALVIDRVSVHWIRAEDWWIDLHEVIALHDACLQHDHRDPVRCQPCAERSSRIVVLYRGTFLADIEVRDSDLWNTWLDARRQHINRIMVEHLDLLAAYHSARGEFDSALRFAQQSVERDPLREEAQRHLIALHAQAGDRAAALAHAERWRVLLYTELGVEPAAETLALIARIESDTSVRTPRLAPLPPAIACIGRDAELVALDSLMRDGARFITITGPGGTGKTSIALELAHRRAGPVVFVALAALETSHEVGRAIADATGVALDPTIDTWQQLARALASSSLTLVLDNFEHLIDAAPLAVSLSERAPGVSIVVTSREGLRVRGETVFPLAGLAADAAGIALFILTARRRRADWLPTVADREEIARICTMLGGLPLAIELAAAWIDVLRPTEIADEIARDPDMLRATSRDAAPAHHSMRHVFERSWSLLAAPEHDMLRQLAVFADTFDRHAARGIVYEDEQPLSQAALIERLQVLVSASLCRVIVDADTTRYGFHPLVQRFALDRLVASADALLVHRRHAHWFRERVDTGTSYLEREFADVRAAFAWTLEHEPEHALTFALALAPFWSARGYWDEGERWIGRVLALPHPPSADLIHVLIAAASLATLRGDPAFAVERAERAHDLSVSLGDDYGVARSLNQLGSAVEYMGDDDRAASYHAASIETLRRLGDVAALAAALGDLGDITRRRGGDPLPLYEEAHALARQHKDAGLLARTLQDLAVARREGGDFVSAVAMLRESVALSRTLDDRLTHLGAMTQLGEALRLVGEHAEAIALQEWSVREARSLGSAWSIAWTLLNLARAVGGIGDTNSARQHLADARSLAREANDHKRVVEIEQEMELWSNETDTGHPAD